MGTRHPRHSHRCRPWSLREPSRLDERLGVTPYWYKRVTNRPLGFIRSRYLLCSSIQNMEREGKKEKQYKDQAAIAKTPLSPGQTAALEPHENDKPCDCIENFCGPDKRGRMCSCVRAGKPCTPECLCYQQGCRNPHTSGK